jgi:assimilatory nitrate reductase catalytic subunit
MTLLQHGNSVEVASREFPTNRGGLCRKGWAAAELLAAPDRLTVPLMRGGPGRALSEVSWDEAIGYVVDSLRSLQEQYGPDAVGVFGGGGLTNEKAYTLGKFARLVLRTRHIDYNGRFCMASAAVAGQKAFGIDRGLPFPISDLPGAEVIVFAGANPAETMPPLMQYIEEQRRRGGRVIVIDPRRTPTVELADLHLQLAPGTDSALANGILHLLIRDGSIDRDYIRDRTQGFEAVERCVQRYWPDRVEGITGVPVAKLLEAARWLGQARSAMVLTARGSEQQSQGVDNVLSFTNLALALGLPGKPSSGFGCLTGQGNGQGGREHGQKNDQLPGYRKLANDEDRRQIAAIWGVAEDDLPPPGLAACDLFARLGEKGGIRGLWVMGANPVVSAPRASVLERRLAKLDLLVVCDSFLSETASLADVVLPVPHWAEDEGTMTNLEGRVLYRRRAMAAPPGVRSDLTIMKLVAEAFGRGRFVEESPELVFEELRRASSGGIADYAGITYARIRAEDGVFWPCPDTEHAGTPRLFSERFATPNGRGRFYAVEHRAPAEEPDEEYPLYLTTGRLLAQYQSGAQTRRVRSLVEANPEPFVEVHPDTAKGLGIENSDWVCVVTRRGRAYCKARLTDGIRLDTLFMPFHWGGIGRANTLTNDAVDPMSKIPEFKISASRLERAQGGPPPLESISEPKTGQNVGGTA